MAYTVDIQPPAANAAGCSATCDVDYYDRNLPYWEYVYYKLTATFVAGWTFDHFEWRLHTENATTGDTWDDDYVSRDNPATSSGLYDGFADLSEIGTGQGRDVTTITGLKAVFVRAPRVPTHLLVNSATKESPAKLVYYPATNLLVADY